MWCSRRLTPTAILCLGLLQVYAEATSHVATMHLAYRFSNKVSSLNVVFGAAVCCVVAYVLIPSASFMGVWAIFGYQTFFGFGMTIWSINSGLLRQSKAPREVLSQVSAIFSMAATIAVPVGLVAAAGTFALERCGTGWAVSAVRQKGLTLYDTCVSGQRAAFLKGLVL